MKRRLQFAVLVIVPLLVMQSASARVLCSALRSSCAGCSDNGSTSSQNRSCPARPSQTTSGQNACCQAGSPEPAQQVRSNAPAVGQEMAFEAATQTLAWFIEPVPSGLHLNPEQAIRKHVGSLQSLYRTFLI